MQNLFLLKEMAKERKIKQVLQRKDHKSLAKRSPLLTWCIFSKLPKSVLLKINNNRWKLCVFCKQCNKTVKGRHDVPDGQFQDPSQTEKINNTTLKKIGLVFERVCLWSLVCRDSRKVEPGLGLNSSSSIMT